tara:strand:+ start:803 stop:955 length:153 start_codon:yes stop_codon:yes gene_type:complete
MLYLIINKFYFNMWLITKIKNYFKRKKQEKIYKKKLAELRKRDPFIYKNH